MADGDAPDLSLIPEPLWQEAERRTAVLRPLADLATCSRDQARIAATASGVTERQVYRLLRKYRAGGGAPSYGAAITELKAEGRLPPETEHRQVKYLSNVVEADHGKLKQLIRPVRGFKTLSTADATIKGFEVMRALRKGQASAFNLTRDMLGEARMIERAFGVGNSALADAVAFLEKHLEPQHT